MGVVFGIALEKSRVFEPGAIVSQMQLRTFLMLKIFLTAVVTGLIVLAALNGVWGVKMHPKALVWPADIVGGLILGVGISIAGACPGTVFAQLGAGYRDAWFTVAGGILGAMAFGYLEPMLRPVLLSGGRRQADVRSAGARAVLGLRPRQRRRAGGRPGRPGAIAALAQRGGPQCRWPERRRPGDTGCRQVVVCIGLTCLRGFRSDGRSDRCCQRHDCVKAPDLIDVEA